MAATPEYYTSFVESVVSSESTYLVVGGAVSRAAVAVILGADLGNQVEDVWDEHEVTGWAIGELVGPGGEVRGVLALEPTGYGDPATETLRRLSESGRAAAVVRDNVQGHVRFGCARNGELLFDDDEYMYIDDTSAVPDEVRALFDLVWDDLVSDVDRVAGPNSYAVGMAMVEVITGLEVSAPDLTRVQESGYFRAPALVYMGE